MNLWMAGINQMAVVALAALLNTLWYAAAVVGLAWVALRYLRRVNAATRYWIWTAVLGFLVPLPFLPALASRLQAAHPAAAAIAQVAMAPAVPQAVQHLAPVTITLGSTPGPNHWPLYLLALWTVITAWQLALLLRGVISVKRMKARAKAEPLVQLPVQPRRKLEVLASDEIDSPVAVGYVHPAVILPNGLPASLEKDEMQDVLLHELAHLARYDDWLNLATRGLGALLVLHPLTAIVLRQIEREREMACDDFVVAHTGSAQSYAKNLARLHDLRSRTGTRLLASALLGRKVSLPDRIEALLHHGRQFSTKPSLANVGLSALLLMVSLGASGLIPSWIAFAQSQAASPAETRLAKTAKFEMASIKHYKRPPKGSVLIGMFVPARSGRLSAMGTTVRGLIFAAYGVEDAQIAGGPEWTTSERFDIQAEADHATRAELRKLSIDQAILVKRHMIQKLLAGRFALKFHHETRNLPVYALMVAGHGPKLREVDKPTAPPGEAGGPHGPKGRPDWFEHDPRRAAAFGSYTTMSEEARNLSGLLGRPVLDRTGLTGHYSFALYWSMTPGERLNRLKPYFGRAQSMGAASRAALAPGPSGPSIFTALREQLGLKLKPEKGPVDILVVDHVEHPTLN